MMSIACSDTAHAIQHALVVTGCLGSVLLCVALSSRILKFVFEPIEENLTLTRQYHQDIGHELATPISLLKTRLQLLRAQQPAAESHQDWVVLEETADRIFDIVADLRLLTESEDPRRHPDLSIVQVHQVVEQTVSRIRPIFDSRSISLNLERMESSVIAADREGIARVIDNILKNAANHVPAGCTVTIRLTNERRKIVLAIADNGNGIEDLALQHVFERFYRADERPKSGGTGLGLAIAKSIVEAHGGSIRVRNIAPHGAEFIVELPSFPEKHPFLTFIQDP